MTTYDELIEARLRGEAVSPSQLSKLRQATDLAELDRRADEVQAAREKEAAQIAMMEEGEAVMREWGAARTEILSQLCSELNLAIERASASLASAYNPVGQAQAKWRRVFPASADVWTPDSPFPVGLDGNPNVILVDAVFGLADRVRQSASVPVERYIQNVRPVNGNR